jgi:hypothetical protein
MTVLTEFVEKYLDKPWNYLLLSKNNSITPEFINCHLDKPWN